MKDGDKTKEQLISELLELRQRIAELEATENDLKQSDEALRKAEMLNRSLLEGSPVCNKIIDLDFKLQYMSAAGIKLLKIPDIKPYYGQTYPPKFYPKSMRAPLIKGLKLAMAGKSSSVEAPVHDMEGNEVWYHTTFVPAFNDDGRVKYVIGTSVDITERRQVEAELERHHNHLEALVKERTAELSDSNKTLIESEERFRLLIHTAGSVIVCLSEDYNIIEFNPEAERIYEKKREEVIGKNYLELLIPKESRKKVSLDIKEVLSGKQTRGFENEVFSGDGNKRLFIWNADRLLDFNGNPIGIIAVGHDITERKQAEDNATRLGHILESSLNEIYLFNAETLQFIQVNRGARDNLGYSMDELLELTPLDLKPEFTHESFAELVEPLRTGRKEVVQFNTVHKRKDKTLYPVEVHLQLTTHGFFSAFVAVILDISERKIAEQKREKLLNELQETLAHVKTLSGLLPICAHCKKIRDDGGYWNQIEKYIKDHSEVDFSHSICPECMKKHFDIEV